MITPDEWVVARIKNSTIGVTNVYPNYVPESTTLDYADKIPCFTYSHIGFDKNRQNRDTIISITSIHNSKANLEILNDKLYTLFDDSTARIRETSSNLSIESVKIINNVPSLYDDENGYWTRPLDISVWYHY